MNKYEIALIILCFIFTTSLTWITRCLKNKIEMLEDKIERLDMTNDMNDAKLERLEDDIYALMDKFKKLESYYNNTWRHVDDGERGGSIELHL